MDPAVVAWFAKASIFHSVNLAPSANGGFESKYGVLNIVDKEIQIIDGDQKDDFRLWEVHIKQNKKTNVWSGNENTKI